MLRISLLGSFEVIRNGDALEARDWGRRKTELLLKYFAAHRGRAITQDQLLEAIYPEQPNDKSVRNLLGRISELRRVLEPGLTQGNHSRFILRVGKGTYMLPDDAPCAIDIEDFRGHVSAGMEFARVGTWRDAIRELERGATLYRGDFLGEELYEEWTIPLRENLRERLRDALLTLGSALRKEHAFAKAVEHYDRAIELDPLDEAAYRGKMLAVYEAGDPARAEDVYATCIRRLEEGGLDPEPEPETEQLHKAVLERSVPLEAAPVRNNLPRYGAPFFGREAEIARIHELFEARDNPVVTLLGTGGIGKTRLAVEAASRALHHFPDGVFLVSATEGMTTDRLLADVAETADIPLEHGENAVKHILRSLRDKQMLFILDNGEHASDAVELLEEFVLGTNVQVVAASRERLRVPGEHVLELHGLSYCEADQNNIPDLDTLAGYEACRLLEDRMRRVSESFEFTADTVADAARICRVTEGMPLAIELAATWGRVLPLSEIARGIQQSAVDLESHAPETPREHRSMRAVFEHTWTHLTPEERTVFARLSVFKQSMSTDAALQVGACTLSTIMSLRDKALLRRTPAGRCSIHELLRQFGNRRLTDMPKEQDEAHAEHARFFADVVERHTEDLFGPGQTEALAVLHADAGNIQVAWVRHVAARNYTALQQMIRGIFRYYQIQTNWHELHTLLHAALNSLEGAEGGRKLDHVRARCYLYKGVALAFGSNLAAGRELLDKALELARKIGDSSLQGECLMEIGSARYTAGDYGGATEAITRGLEILRELDEKHSVGRALTQLGVSLSAVRDYDGALRVFNEAEQIFAELGDPRESTGAALNLGTTYGRLGDLVKARQLFEESLRMARKAGHRHLRLMALANIGYVAYLERDFHAAKDMYREAWELTAESSNFESQPQLAYYLCLVYTQLGEYDEALRFVRQGLATAQELGSPPAILRNVYALGGLLRARGRLEQAAGLFAFALDNPATAGPTRAGIKADLETLHKDLTPEIAKKAEAWAKTLTLESIVQWAESTSLLQ